MTLSGTTPVTVTTDLVSLTQTIIEGEVVHNTSTMTITFKFGTQTETCRKQLQDISLYSQKCADYCLSNNCPDLTPYYKDPFASRCIDDCPDDILRVVPLVFLWKCVMLPVEHAPWKAIRINAQVVPQALLPLHMRHLLLARQLEAAQSLQQATLNSLSPSIRTLFLEQVNSSKSTSTASFTLLQEPPCHHWRVSTQQTWSSLWHCQSTLSLSLLEGYQPFTKNWLSGSEY